MEPDQSQSQSGRRNHPAARSRVAVSGVTAIVAVGSIAAMADASQQETVEDSGHAFGVVARFGGEIAAIESMSAADPGAVTGFIPPPLALSDVS